MSDERFVYPKVEYDQALTFLFHYNAMNDVMKLIKDEQLDILEQHFDMECRMRVAVPKSRKELLTAALEKIIK